MIDRCVSCDEIINCREESESISAQMTVVDSLMSKLVSSIAGLSCMIVTTQNSEVKVIHNNIKV